MNFNLGLTFSGMVYILLIIILKEKELNLKKIRYIVYFLYLHL